MIVRQINYDDNQEIETITVRMTYKEAVAITNLLGKLNGYGQGRLDIDSDAYNCLSGIMNSHFEDGVPNLHIDLETINKEKI